MGLVFASCNAPIESIVKKPIKIDENFQSTISYKLLPIVDIESLRELKIKDVELGDYHCNLIQKHIIKDMESDLNTNLFSFSDKTNYSGYVKCTLVSQKQKSGYWEFVPSILTLWYYALCGGPICHTTLKREYRFDIYDAMGTIIKSYTFIGKGKNQHGLYSKSNWDGTELKAFRSALKQFEIAASKDAYLINHELRKGSDDFNAKASRSIGEYELALANRLNSGNMPTERELNKAISTAPDDFVGWGLRAINNADKGQFTNALSDIEKYCKLNPTCDIIRPYYYKAIILYKLSRLGEAYEALCVANRIYPKVEAINLLRGSILYEEGAYDVALDAFEEALEINPNNTETFKTISQLRNVCKQMQTDRRNADINESLRRAMAMQMLSNASSTAMSSIGNMVNPSNSSIQTSVYNLPNLSNGGTRQSHTVTRECSMCHGKGWIAGTSTVSFASSHPYYCEECHREVPSSHSHDTCPSCKGKKEITTIRR